MNLKFEWNRWACWICWWGYLCKYQLDVNIPPVWPYMEFWWNSEDQPNGFLRIIIGKKFLFQSCLAKLQVAGFKPVFLVFRISCTSRIVFLWSSKMWTSTRCGNFRIFLSFRFYVKSILENLAVHKLLFFAITGARNFVNLVNFSLQNVQKCSEIKIQSL